jgi:hypothetical protein
MKFIHMNSFIYRHIHPYRWIKITLNFKFQAQNFKLRLHAHAQAILMHVRDTNVAIVSSMEWL